MPTVSVTEYESWVSDKIHTRQIRTNNAHDRELFETMVQDLYEEMTELSRKDPIPREGIYFCRFSTPIHRGSNEDWTNQLSPSSKNHVAFIRVSGV